MEIPYTVHPREDTGLYNAKLGIWLFLASEVMLFGGLFSAYILLRVGADRARGRTACSMSRWAPEHARADQFQYHGGDGLGIAEGE